MCHFLRASDCHSQLQGGELSSWDARIGWRELGTQFLKWLHSWLGVTESTMIPDLSAVFGERASEISQAQDSADWPASLARGDLDKGPCLTFCWLASTSCCMWFNTDGEVRRDSLIYG